MQNALGWVALAEFRPGLLVLDGWREMSAKDWTDCVQPLFRLCPGAKLLALGEPDAPGDSCRAAEEMLAEKNLDKRDMELAEARLRRALVRSSVAARKDI